MTVDDEARGVWSGLTLLAAVVVLSVIVEEMPTGLLPQMAAELRVAPSQIGLLVSLFALTVAITSVPLVLLTRRRDRRIMLTVATLGLGLSSIAGAIAPDFASVAVTRIVGGLFHGLFWSLVGAYLGHVLPPHRRARGIAVVLGGSTVGFIAGVPIATLLGQAWGWRAAFVTFGVLLCVASAFLVRFLVPAAGSGGASIGRDRSVAPTLLLCAAALVVMTGHFGFYTYIAPYVVDVGGLPSGGVAGALLVCGAAGALGLALSTRFGSRIALGAAISLLASGLAIVVLMTVAGHPVPFLVVLGLWSAAFALLPPLLQNAILTVASPAFRDLGSAVYTAAFNLGIGSGAALGSLVYATVGIAAVPLPYLAVLAGAAAVAFVLVFRRSVTARLPRAGD